MSRLPFYASKSRFIAILIIAVLFGAVASYMWVAGYYIALGLQVPESSAVTVDKTEFNPENATFFNATLLNPSYSKSKISVEKIQVIINGSEIQDVKVVSPTLPAILEPGERQNFLCSWNWGMYTDQNVTLFVEASKGNGAVYNLKVPQMRISIAEAVFNASMAWKWKGKIYEGGKFFNVTLKSENVSSVPVNITRIMINGEEPKEIKPNLGQTLKPGSEMTFWCGWGWTDHIGGDYNITVLTEQGYEITKSGIIPLILEMKDVNFDPADTSRFNFTLKTTTAAFNYTQVVIVYVELPNGTRLDLSSYTQPEISVDKPYVIERGLSVTFETEWNWKPFVGQKIMVGINTYRGVPATKHIILPTP